MDIKITATLDTRRAAELAVEHLVQEHKVDRSKIVVAAEGASNSSGTERSGGDSLKDQSSDTEPKLKGAIRVTVACDEDKRDLVVSSLKEAGASNISA